jgi:hypothetical protein
MADTFDPDEKFNLPERTNLDEVLRRLMEADRTDEVSSEPEDVEETDS